ncbi:MAG: Uma2 family endonuclease [Planctomycetota bacterium]
MTSLKASIAQYDEMVAKGAFDGLGQKIELIEGEIQAMNPAGPRHDHLIEFLTHWSVERTDFSRVRVRVQSGLTLPEQESRPEPDVFWVKAERPSDRHPIAREVLLLIEVSDSSLRVDRDKKANLYARAGIIEYWVVNVSEQLVHVYRDPADSGYGSMRTIAPGDSMTPLAAPEATLDPADLFR